MSTIHSCHLLFDHFQFALIHGPDIPGSYAILFFAASDFTFITRHIHNWASFPLWPSCFFLSGAVRSSPLLFPSSILDTHWPRGLSVISFCPFIHFMRFSQVYWGGLPFHPSMDHILSELSAMTHPSWVALHNMAYSFIKLRSPCSMTMQWSMKGIYSRRIRSRILKRYWHLCLWQHYTTAKRWKQSTIHL